MRLPEGPWYRASRDAWYVEVDGKQVRLAKGKANKKAALTAFHRLMALGPGGLPKNREITVAHVCDLFLTAVCPYDGDPPKKQPKANDPEPALKPGATHDVRTYWWYRSFLESFCGHKRVGHLNASELKVFHVTQWLKPHPGAAVAPLQLGVDLLDGRDQSVPPLLGRGGGAAGPGVVAGLRHLQGIAGPRHRAVAAVVGDEAEGQFGGLAK